MILAVDIGNSNIVIGGYQQDGLQFSARFKTDSRKTEWEYAVTISEVLMLNRCQLPQFEGMALSSVVPALTFTLRKAGELLGIKKVMVVAAGLKTGLNIRIDDPGETGADLVCTAVGTVEKYPLPAIIIDMGTATKISVVDKNRNFVGGAISPGVMVALSALSTSAAQLPHIGLESEIKVIGTNTVDCMLAGSILGAAAMLDGMILRYREIIGDEGSVVACGGLARGIVRYCRTPIILDDHLLLDGLMAIYRKNTPQNG